MVSESDKSFSSAAKRLKTSFPTLNLTPKSEIDKELDPNTCAICFFEDGKATKGEIDCCDHYFCFICIMEWSKTESRCPICRQRFSTIRRPPKFGVLASERVVQVPIRDQVDVHYGNTSGSVYPYEQISCGLCHHMTDESLLLLCDLCDSAAHTYCVGLGSSVPEEDWFCHDCSVSRADYSASEKSKEDDENISNLPQPSISPFDIVHRPFEMGVATPSTRVSSNSSGVSPLSVSDRRISAADEVNGLGAYAPPTFSNKQTVFGARTLFCCCNVHIHIRALRENWNELQSGSLSFSSISFKPTCSVLHDISDEMKSSSSRHSQDPKGQGAFCTYDIDRAWKMMDIVRSKQHPNEKNNRLQLSKPPNSIAGDSKEKTNVRPRQLVKIQQGESMNLGASNMEKPLNRYFIKMETKKPQYTELEKKMRTSYLSKEASGSSWSLTRSYSPDLLESSFSNKACTSLGTSFSYENSSIVFLGNVNKASSSIISEQCGSACLKGRVTSDSFVMKPEPDISNAGKVDCVAKIRSGCGLPKNKMRKDSDAKCEIQLLVKINLKLLSRQTIGYGVRA